jgi:uncharacterized membrane protein YqgA involved in biofilm formation
MTGTLLNIFTILLGSAIGLLVGNRLPERTQQSVMIGLGLVTLANGVQSVLGTGNILIPLLSLVIGVIIGEALNVEGKLQAFGAWLQARVAQIGKADGSSSSENARVRFINGFVTASLVFCIGPMAIIGSIQNGIDVSDVRLLAIKSTLDFFASIAFAASLGIGVAFSILPTFVIQGAFTLVGVFIVGAAGAALSANNPVIRELSATGGLLLMALSLVLMDIKNPRVANFLPALLVAPLMVWGAGVLGINIYPL